ncbi:helix-turn-helix domain-containing protein [Methylomonas sp. 2BW1-5-20]|uniref:helix-turn-helix domain-containing protein n=1 Tax=Methylomonas sp. 2BW1-5-20 TaxID=3376686 RepID=UPI00404D4E2E
MNTLDLHQAAALLKLHPQTILQKARAGDIPAAKPGKCWVFIEQDLIDWIRSQYTRPRQDVGQGESTCSLKDQTVNSGGIALPHQTAQQYANLLKLTTSAKRKS